NRDDAVGVRVHLRDRVVPVAGPDVATAGGDRAGKSGAVRRTDGDSRDDLVRAGIYAEERQLAADEAQHPDGVLVDGDRHPRVDVSGVTADRARRRGESYVVAPNVAVFRSWR